MNTRTIAVIGAGYWGKNLVRNFHQLGVLKAICDAEESIRSLMVANYPDVKIVGKLLTSIEENAMDAVYDPAQNKYWRMFNEIEAKSALGSLKRSINKSLKALTIIPEYPIAAAPWL